VEGVTPPAGTTLDIGFGDGGTVRTEALTDAEAVLQPDGRIVAAGRSGAEFALARYDPDGSLDVTFGSGRKVTTNIAGVTDLGQAVALQPDGKLVIAGSAARGFTTDVALVRIDP
jgi:uncharacterized delta-60 repeat protein